MEYVKFVVDKSPYTCWDWELRKKNLEFLEGIDSDYFKYVAETNIENIENADDKHRAAISLRLSFSHGLETLFALLCSSLQAPNCPVAWLLSYKNSQLINLVNKISNQEEFYSRFKDPYVTWKILAKHIHSNLDYEKDKIEWIQKGFGNVWTRLSRKFTDIHFSDEYNGMKHGLRAMPGGFHLAIGQEDIPGIPAPPEKMQSMGGSDYGSTYFVKEYPIPFDKINFRPRRHSHNWSPNDLAYDLLLISMSIQNIVSWLRIVNGEQPNKCKFSHPDSKEKFDPPIEGGIGVTHLNFDLLVNGENITPFTKEDILNEYENH